MPFVYITATIAVATNFACSGTPDTEVDQVFIKPGTRNIGILSLSVGGKAAGATSISGIAYRLKRQNGTASSGGTAVTPTPVDPGAQAAKATAGAASGGVVEGTTHVYIGGCFSGVAGPGGWVAPNPDALPTCEGGSNTSIDLYSASHSASVTYDAIINHVE